MKFKKIKGKHICWPLIIVLVIFAVWQYFLPAPLERDWQLHTAVMPTVDFDGNLATIHNVRNFRYSSGEEANVIDYYDQTYDLDKVTKVWYINEPFSETKNAAHTFLSWEFSDGKFLSITIEARKTKGQVYNIFKGLFRTYPLMYIAADERDAIMVRANLRQHDVYLYPVKTTSAKAQIMLKNMLIEMNDLLAHPKWYNTLTANCTSLIAKHVNEVTPARLPFWSWQLLLTGHADELAMEAGLLDTELSIEQAREKFNITKISQEVGDVSDYSVKIRENLLP